MLQSIDHQVDTDKVAFIPRSLKAEISLEQHIAAAAIASGALLHNTKMLEQDMVLDNVSHER